jgi:hypothetical protein
MIMKYLLMGISLMLIFLATAELSAAQLYTWMDENGNLHITQTPPPKNAKLDDVMTYKPLPEAQTAEDQETERREEMQDQAARQKISSPETENASTQTEQQDDEEVYIGREGKIIRRAEESAEMRDRRQDVRREYRIRRR